MEQISLHILECYLIKVMTANKHSESILLPHHLQFGELQLWCLHGTTPFYTSARDWSADSAFE